MICKINQGMSFRGLIDYITNELKDGHVIASQGVCTASKRAILDSFAIQCSMGATRTQYPVGHFAMSWHRDERPRMTDEFMARLAREFMDELGYGQTQYVVTVHKTTKGTGHFVVLSSMSGWRAKTFLDAAAKVIVLR